MSCERKCRRIVIFVCIDVRLMHVTVLDASERAISVVEASFGKGRAGDSLVAKNEKVSSFVRMRE